MGCTTLRDCFVVSFARHADKKAVIYLRRGRPETELTFREIDRDSNRLANAFLSRGIQRGDRVILYFDKCLLFMMAHLALQKIGVTAIPLNPGFKASEMAYLVNDADAKLVLAGAKQEPIIRQIDPDLPILAIDSNVAYQEVDFFRSESPDLPAVEVAPEDTGLIIYTSGTTGDPKGAMLTHANLVHDANKVIRVWEIATTDVLCHALPLFHVHGLCFALHTMLMSGARTLMLNTFDPQTVVQTLQTAAGESACTVFMAVPSMYSKLLDYAQRKGFDFDHMRLWTSGSAPLLVKDFDRIAATFGRQPVEREGMSETGMNFSNPVRGVRKPGSIGVALPDLEVRVVNPETRQDVEPGQRGEFWLQGPGITPGYWRKPKETSAAFMAGWFRTGDLGYVDDDGYYFLTDRLKHIIISGGENISPNEIEKVINRLDGVVESCVVGLPDPKWGEKVVAAIVTKEGASLGTEDLRSHCKEHLHDWKCPKEFLRLDHIPRNTMGKVLKEEVKKRFQ